MHKIRPHISTLRKYTYGELTPIFSSNIVLLSFLNSIYFFFIFRQAYPGQTWEVFPQEQHRFGPNRASWLYVTGHPRWSHSTTTPSHPRQLSPTGLLSNGPPSPSTLTWQEKLTRVRLLNFHKDRLLRRREAPSSSPLSFYMQEASYEAFWPLLPLAAFTILFAFRLTIRFVHKIWLKIAIHVNNAQFCMSNIVNVASKSKC